VIRALAVLALLSAAVAAVVVFVNRGIDRDAYVSRNVAVLDSLPVFPGAREVQTLSRECLESDTPHAAVVGYWTSRKYALSRPVSAQHVWRFFRVRLGTWKRVSAGDYWLNVTRNRTWVYVAAEPTHWGRPSPPAVAYWVSVDYKSAGCPGP
jgi:hypothetical protein